MSALIILTVLSAVAVWLLLHHLEPERDTKARLILRVDEILPQTQCRECGYNGCLPYAEAIIGADERIDKCPPGGAVVRRSLAELLGRTSDSLRRVEDSQQAHRVVIDEAACIGCTKCIDACPVDAIVGAAKQMHSVIRGRCTGCDLCLPPCPVDCIVALAAESELADWRWPPPRHSGVERRSA